MELYTLKAAKYQIPENKPYPPENLDTLDSERSIYDRDEIVDEYESLVWTERFIEAGDMRMLIPANERNVKILKKGTLVNLSNSKEVMIIESRTIENDTITIVARDALEVFFANRYFAFYPYAPRISWVKEEELTSTPRRILRTIAIFANRRYDSWDTYYRIPGFIPEGISQTDESPFVTETIPYGKAYETLLKIAKKYHVGLGIYLEKNALNGHDLVFRTRLGADLSDEIIFAPELDNFANVKELASDADSANVVVALPPKEFAQTNLYLEPIFANNIGLEENFPWPASLAKRSVVKRVFEIENDDLTDAKLGGSGATQDEKRDKLRSILRRRAREKLQELKSTRIVDGEVTPEAQYKYHSQPNPNNDPVYRLGDKVQIAGKYTKPEPGIITEFTQSEDATGYRAYPTVVSEADLYDDTHENNSFGGQ